MVEDGKPIPPPCVTWETVGLSRRGGLLEGQRSKSIGNHWAVAGQMTA